MIDKDAQAENVTVCGIIYPEYDEFKYKKQRHNKFSKVCFSLGNGSKDSFYNVTISGISSKLNIEIEDIDKINTINEPIIKKLTEIKREREIFESLQKKEKVLLLDKKTTYREKYRYKGSFFVCHTTI